MIEFTAITTGGFSSCSGCGKDMQTTGRELRVNATPENPGAYTALRFCPACLAELHSSSSATTCSSIPSEKE